MIPDGKEAFGYLCMLLGRGKPMASFPQMKYIWYMFLAKNVVD